MAAWDGEVSGGQAGLAGDAGMVPGQPSDEWVERESAALRRVLSNPHTRARLIEVLTGVEDRRERRLAELAEEIDAMEVRWRITDEGEAWES